MTITLANSDGCKVNGPILYQLTALLAAWPYTRRPNKAINTKNNRKLYTFL